MNTQERAIIGKLVAIANGDIDLVQQAIRASAAALEKPADLEKVVEYIRLNRRQTNRQQREVA